MDPQERQEVVNLLSRLSLASKKIDTVVDGIKMQIVRLEIEGLADALVTAVTDAGRTVENVRTDTTEPGLWSALRDKVGAKRSLRLRYYVRNYSSSNFGGSSSLEIWRSRLEMGGQMGVRPRKESRLRKRMRIN